MRKKIARRARVPARYNCQDYNQVDHTAHCVIAHRRCSRRQMDRDRGARRFLNQFPQAGKAAAGNSLEILT